jgi:hypothetical protein
MILIITSDQQCAVIRLKIQSQFFQLQPIMKSESKSTGRYQNLWGIALPKERITYHAAEHFSTLNISLSPKLLSSA